MPKQCKTCPFLKDESGRYLNPELAYKVEATIMNVSRICHHPRLKGKKETHLCRGARNIQIEIFHRIGFLDEPTDEAWAKKLKECLAGRTREA